MPKPSKRTPTPTQKLLALTLNEEQILIQLLDYMIELNRPGEIPDNRGFRRLTHCDIEFLRDIRKKL